MGQQQLLLVILVTIVVGIATVVAISTFGAAADSANIDAVRQDLVAMGAAAQGYYTKPTMMGGGSRAFNNITFYELAFAGIIVEDDLGVNENGTYEIASADGQTLTLTAYGASEEGYDSNTGPATFTAVISSQDIDIQAFSEE
jgi:Tfp pilus assembly protein PilE